MSKTTHIDKGRNEGGHVRRVLFSVLIGVQQGFKEVPSYKYVFVNLVDPLRMGMNINCNILNERKMVALRTTSCCALLCALGIRSLNRL